MAPAVSPGPPVMGQRSDGFLSCAVCAAVTFLSIGSVLFVVTTAAMFSFLGWNVWIFERLGVDRLALLILSVDGDFTWLGLLRDRDPQAQHTAVIVRLDILRVQVLT